MSGIQIFILIILIILIAVIVFICILYIISENEKENPWNPRLDWDYPDCDDD